MLDGCGRLGAIRHVVLPLALPGLVAVAMFTAILSWNEYLYAVVLLNDESVRTLPVGVAASYMGTDMTALRWARLMAASVITSLPVLLFFVLLQRKLVSGLSAGAVKG